MGFIDKIKTNIEVWKIERYTKRRHISSPEFEQRDRDFYREHYKDGVYLHQQPGQHQTQQPARSNSIRNSISRRTTLLRNKSEKIIRSSENYNSSH